MPQIDGPQDFTVHGESVAVVMSRTIYARLGAPALSLVDTDTLLALRRQNPEPSVVEWFAHRAAASLCLSVLTLVTRNEKDFAGFDLELINPWRRA